MRDALFSGPKLPGDNKNRRYELCFGRGAQSLQNKKRALKSGFLYPPRYSHDMMFLFLVNIINMVDFLIFILVLRSVIIMDLRYCTEYHVYTPCNSLDCHVGFRPWCRTAYQTRTWAWYDDQMSYFCMHIYIYTLRIQICPKKGISSTILFPILGGGNDLL